MKRKFKYTSPTAEDYSNDKEIFKKVKFTGVEPSPEDIRDFVACSEESIKFPKEYLAPEVAVFNQGSLSDCVANSCSAALSEGEEVSINVHNVYSRGYIYGNRTEDDYQGEGMYVRQALKQLHHCGDVLEKDFPYRRRYELVKNLIERDKEVLAKLASEHTIIDYFRCYTESQIKKTIMERGCVIISVPVYSDFGRDLHITKTNKLTGHHAMIIIGWTKDDKWVVQNSWGELWGYGGRLLMDADYPVNEYWGLTVRINEKDIPEPKEKGVFEKMWDAIVDAISKIKLLFRK